MKIDKKFPEQPSVLPVPADLHSEQGLRSEQGKNISMLMGSLQGHIGAEYLIFLK